MMSKRRVFFRADGNSEMGLGHVIRSLALADMLRATFECHFIIRTPLDSLCSQILEVCQSLIPLPSTQDDLGEAQAIAKDYLRKDDIVVLDGYHFITNYQRVLKDFGCKVVCIDDIKSYHFVADVVINHAPGLLPTDYSVDKETILCLGLDFALLRKPFLDAAKRQKLDSEIQKMFVCFGGSDHQNLTLKTLLGITSCSSEYIKVHVVIGSANQHKNEIELFAALRPHIVLHENLSALEICQLLESCQIAIVPASSILFEAVAVKTLIVSGFYVDNQHNVNAGFHELGLIYSIGDFNKFNNYNEVLSKLNREDYRKAINLQSTKFRGDSDLKLLEIFEKL